MEPGTHSSFIPHDTAEQSGPRRAASGSFADFVALISAVLFIASIVLGLGVFLYQQFLDTSAKSKVTQLERAKAAFDPALIKELTRLDDRMRVADQILNNHNALSIFFRMLEQVTLTTVSFRSLNFEAADPQNITIKMTGVAESVNAVALQADLFGRNGIVASPIFSNIDRQPDGVHFSLTALINPSSIRYAQTAASGAAAGGIPPAPSAEAIPEALPGTLQGNTPAPTNPLQSPLRAPVPPAQQ